MLPPQLSAAIGAAAQGVPAKDIARSVQALTARYRGESQAGGRAIRSDVDVLAYLSYRLPATYAAVAAALAATAARRPGWGPGTLLDLGAGPGTAMWAAAELWPSVEAITLVETDPRMVATGRRLAQASSNRAIRDARWCEADMSAGGELPHCEMVVAAYSLGELPSARLGEVAKRLWGVCQDTLVVIEPGTPSGFATVRAIRDLLRTEGAQTVAPCPHQDACPMDDGRWCHFSERLERSRLHRATKGTTLAYEDEKYSYVALSRTPGSPIDARVVGHPRTQSGRVSLDLCTAAGLRSEMVSRRDRDRYRIAQRARWGSALNQPDRADERQSRRLPST